VGQSLVPGDGGFSSPAGPAIEVGVRDGVTRLAFPGSVAFHETQRAVGGVRVIALPDSRRVVVLWTEGSAGATPEAFYAISPDGRRADVVRSTSYRILLRYANFDPLVAEVAVEPVVASGGDTKVYIVQFVTQPLPEYRDALRGLGASVYQYIGEHAHIVRMDPGVVEAVSALPFVRWVGPLHPAYRLEEYMLDNLARADELFPEQRYNVMVFEPGEAMKNVVADRIESLGGTINMRDAGKYLLEATLTPAQLLAVIRFDEVMFVDRWGPYETDMDIARGIGGANYIENLEGFDGTGVRGEVIDIGFNVGHMDFQSRPLIQHTAVDSQSHGAATSGIIFGDGTGNPQARGLLPKAQGIVADWDVVSVGQARYDHTGELPEAPYFAVFQSSSVGSPRTTQYTTISADTDVALFDFDVVHCQSQSNAGNQNSRPQAWAKNIISVGGVFHNNTLDKADDRFTSASTGPASDGRIKPELTHFYDNVLTTYCCASNSYTTGFNGTSAATPIVSGHVGLFFEMWSRGIFGNDVDPEGTVFDNRCHMATAKAMMVNSANPYPLTQGGLTRVRQGWGLPDLRNLYDRREKMFIIDETDVLQELGVARYELEVADGEPELRVTMVYTDPPGVPNSQRHRINDLTLKVTSPQSTTYWGNNGLMNNLWSTSGGSANTIDTVENVFVQNPPSGVWVVEVIADEVNEDGHVETQELDADFALVVSGVQSSDPQFLPIDFEVTQGNQTSGDLDDLFRSDNQYIEVEARRPTEVSSPSIEVVLTGTAPTSTPAELTFRIEAATTGVPVRQRVALFNYQIQEWEQFDDRDGPFQDTVVTIVVDQDAARFVEPSDFSVRARVGYYDFSVPFLAWSGRIDHAFWMFTE
jgi:subtilisin family serine protease